MPSTSHYPTRRQFLAGSASALLMGGLAVSRDEPQPALLSITLDLEMSRHYPKRNMMEWDYQKGNLDEDTKKYSREAGRVAKELGGVIHYFCVGRVLEQKDVSWLTELIAEGHPVGNHTYDHVNVMAQTPEECQFRFQRSPWLVENRTAADVISSNIDMTTRAMNRRLQSKPDGFRTPGGFYAGLTERPDLQAMMKRQGFNWVSSMYPPHLRGEPKSEPGPEVYESIVAAQEKAQPFVYPNGLIEIPMSPISDVTAFRSTFWKLPYFLKAVRLAVEWAIRTGGVFDFLAHPSCLVVEDPQFETVKLICNLAREAGDRAKVVGLSTVAERVRARAGG